LSGVKHYVEYDVKEKKAAHSAAPIGAGSHAKTVQTLITRLQKKRLDHARTGLFSGERKGRSSEERDDTETRAVLPDPLLKEGATRDAIARIKKKTRCGTKCPDGRRVDLSPSKRSRPGVVEG